METLSILHIENTAGVPRIIASGQNKIGHVAKVLETFDNHKISNITYEHDYELYYTGSILKDLNKMRKVIGIARSYDIIHFHSGLATKRYESVALKRIFGKPIIVHYHGSESRLGYGMYHDNIIDAKVVATPDLLQFQPNAEFIPNPMWHRNVNDFSVNDKIVISHLPTNRERKGTAKVLDAVEKLRKITDVDFVFNLIENVAHDVAIDAILNSDIIIDQISSRIDGKESGMFGMVSLESMSLGKVSVCHLNQTIEQYYPAGLPIVNSDDSSDALALVLKDLIDDRRHISEIKKQSHEWMKSLLPEKIAEQHIGIYKRVLDSA